MISRNFLLHKIGSAYSGNKKMLVADQSTGDIIQAILDAHEKYKNQYNAISSYFKGYNDQQTAKNIFDFLKRNIKYVIESEDQQLVRSPAAILHQAQSDCKCYSLFAAGICESLGISFCFRFASYNYKQKSPQHVFVVINPDTKNEIWCDPVLSYFNYKKSYCYKLDKKPRKMAVYSINGIGATAQKKAKRKAILKNAGKKLKKGVKGVMKVAAAPARNAFLELVKYNVAGLGTKVYAAYQKAPAKLKNFWESIGGRINSLIKAAEKGYKRKRIFGTYEAAIGFAPAAALAAAAPIVASFTKFLQSVGIDPKALVDVAKEAVNKKAQELIANQVEAVEEIENKYQEEANQIFE